MTKISAYEEELDVFIIKILLVALVQLLLGDLLSTFVYHVPEHIFGKFHAIVHHSKNRSFIHYAVLTKNPLVILDGFAGAFPYLMFVPWFWQISPLGTILGLVLGELHVIWRHVSVMEWKTPQTLERLCNFLCITTPEKHWLHHQDATVAYGDIFTFYDQPAQAWYRFLMSVKKKYKLSREKSS
ncbi:sterol desaturase family protein [Moorena producens JHB]|uniref:Sterol desaturase family protein n=1 Tax=Moorena producens (strain JHB) TaxID=1454205 RepID=A0A1D9G0M6_MOOP1|nr:sterol desaturase family protein [Moorena producens]AOY80950.2 sterol desaturase family protein [Moorena producens JHB]